MNIQKTADKINRTAYEKGWWEEERSIGELLALVHSEVSEALEEWRAGHALDEIYYHETGEAADASPKPEGFPIELADVIIRVLDLAYYYEINIEEAIRVKMAFNKTRSYRHGGKRI